MQPRTDKYIPYDAEVDYLFDIPTKPTGTGSQEVIVNDNGTLTWEDKFLLSPFGTEASESADEDITTTTNTNWKQKIRLTVTDITGGEYRIGWSFDWAFSHGNFQFKSRVQINDDSEDQVMEHEVRPAEASVSKFRPDSGFKYVTLSAGTYNIDLDFCSSQSGKTAAIRCARLEFWKKSEA